jgi:hypothetical protein
MRSAERSVLQSESRTDQFAATGYRIGFHFSVRHRTNEDATG